MKYITDNKEQGVIRFFLEQAAKEARKSNCRKSQRGAIVAGEFAGILGRGCNMPTICGKCCMRMKIHDNGQVERCTAIHAEQMAVLNALSSRDSLRGLTLYHIKLKDGIMVPSGHPSCTVCSRIVSFVGLNVVLWHREGIALYGPEEFNELSFKYFLEK
jgi:deoxycytidylate deaminase